MACSKRKLPSWKTKSGKGNRNTRRRTTRNNKTEPDTESTEIVTKSRYLKTTVFGRGDLRTLSKEWVQLGSDQGLILRTDPLGNVLDQVINMIMM